MTAVVEHVTTQLIPGLTFVLNGVRCVLVSPAPESASEARLWAVLTPSTSQLEELVIGEMDWVEPTPLAELVQSLVTGWTTVEREHQYSQVRLARSEQMIEGMRTYAIDKHREGHYCLAGLNKALEHFDLEPYQPRFRFEVTVTATVEIDADDPGAAERRLRYIVDGLAVSGDRDDEEVEVTLQSIEMSNEQVS